MAWDLPASTSQSDIDALFIDEPMLLITSDDVAIARTRILNTRNYLASLALSFESFQKPIALTCDPEEILHTAASGYTCDDPECICHQLVEVQA